MSPPNSVHRRRVLKLCLHQNLVHSHPSLGSRPGHVAQVGGRARALRNPKVKKPKSVAKSGRNPKIVAHDRKLVSDIFASNRRSIGLTLNLPDSRPNRRHFQEVPADADTQVVFFVATTKDGKTTGGSSETGRPSVLFGEKACAVCPSARHLRRRRRHCAP